MKGSKSNLDAEYSCKIRLLDDSEISCDFKKDVKGSDVFNHVCKALDLLEKDYFGLRFVDRNKQRHWLDLSKDLTKQLKYTRQPYMFFFRVRFYPTDPTILHEELTRYQLFLQLKRDILHGRLLCPFNEITELAAYIVQGEIGDYEVDDNMENCVSEMKLLPRQTEKLEERMTEVHKTLSGLTPYDAETTFLKKAKEMDLYGVDPHPCKDEDEAQLYLGLTPQGIQIIRDAKRVSGFPWTEVNKVTYENRGFYIQILKEKEKTNYIFRLTDTAACKHLWRCTVEHMAFYSQDPIKAQSPRRSALSPHNLFRKRKYTYSGKTESQLVSEAEKTVRPQPSFERTPSIRMLQASRKSSAQTNRLSMGPALDDRASQGMSESGNTSASRTSSLSDSSGPDEEKPKMDPLKQFETEDFPPDPPLDASLTSIVFDDDLDPNQNTLNHLDSNSKPQLQSETVSGTIIAANQQRCALLSNPIFWLILIAVMLVPVAVFVEMRYGLISGTKRY